MTDKQIDTHNADATPAISHLQKSYYALRTSEYILRLLPLASELFATPRLNPKSCILSPGGAGREGPRYEAQRGLRFHTIDFVGMCSLSM